MARLVRKPSWFTPPVHSAEPPPSITVQNTHSVDESHVAQQEVEGAQINVMTLRGDFSFPFFGLCVFIAQRPVMTLSYVGAHTRLIS